MSKFNWGASEMTSLPTSRVSINDVLERPELAAFLSPTEMYSIPNEIVAEIQLKGLSRDFDQLIESLPMLRKFAEEQKISRITSLNDGAYLLFPHPVYKSYPLSVLEKSQFDRLTRWLDNLTIHDLSGLDASKCEMIDDWIDLLDSKTPIRVKHSTGTTGKLSFIPRSTSELPASTCNFFRSFEGFGDEPAGAGIEEPSKVPLVFAGYSKGAMGQARVCQNLIELIYHGDANMVFASHPGRLSADMLSLAGRIRAAEAKGERGAIQLSPALLARRDIFVKEQAEVAEHQRSFISHDLMERLFKRQVIVMGPPPSVFDLARLVLARGGEGLFASDSYGVFGGGSKGRTLPDDYEHIIERALGFTYPATSYGMSEMVAGSTRACPLGAFHLPINIIQYLLDPQTGAVLPRTGTQTGRFGFVDLCTQTHWGGFLSGDEITITWDDPCGCGRIGPYVHSSIRRYSEGEGGDDKITCAGAPDMHDKALEFIAQQFG